MKTKKMLLSDTDAAKIYFNWYPEREVERAFGKNSTAQKKWDKFLMGEFEPYIPLETKMLSHSVTLSTTPGNGEIIYHTPYAKFQYYGKMMVDPQTRSSYARSGVTKDLTTKDLIHSQAVNPLAGPFWDRRAANDRFDAWKKFFAGIIGDEF